VNVVFDIPAFAVDDGETLNEFIGERKTMTKTIGKLKAGTVISYTSSDHLGRRLDGGEANALRLHRSA
jgi:hypothetical protein